MTFVPKTIVSSIVKAFEGEARAKAKAIVEQDKAINKALDAIILACDKPKAEFMKGNSTKNPARAEVNEIFGELVKADYISSNTARNYAQCFWIAFEAGIPFTRTLANEKSEATKKDKADKTETAKSGKVVSTTRTELDKTLSKALVQARALGLTEFSATLLDHCLESLDGFKEITSDK
jgi:hypothetical protein